MNSGFDDSFTDDYPYKRTKKLLDDHNSNPPKISAPVDRMMGNMGYVKGKGLGVNGSGILEPLSILGVVGKAGLGSEQSKINQSVDWEINDDPIPDSETIDHIKIANHVDLNILTPNIMVIRKPTFHIENEVDFIDKSVWSRIVSLKGVLDSIPRMSIYKAHSQSNPFESIGKTAFINRAAVKMANLDSLFDYCFTSIKGSVVYYADICAGPGGFTEYLLWRYYQNKVFVKGFGFTLKGDCDFTLDKFRCVSPLFFEPHYGVNNSYGDGDIFKTENMHSFAEYVLSKTSNEGVSFVVADGGFSVAGKENIQEILSKQLYLCQFLLALKILKAGGNFMCKLFDLVTPFSVGLIYLMGAVFRTVSIVKPFSSRPANSERYIFFQDRLGDCSNLIEFLLTANDMINDFKGLDCDDIYELIPTSMIMEDREFVESIRYSNTRIGRLQTAGLAKLIAFDRRRNFVEKRQSVMSNILINKWELTDLRPTDSDVGIHQRLHYLFNSKNTNFELFRQNYVMRLCDLTTYLPHVNNFNVAVVCGDHVSLFSLGDDKVFVWYHSDSKPNGWKSVESTFQNFRLKLPRDTLVEGFLMTEYYENSCKLPALHIIDCAILNGIDVSSIMLIDRLEHCSRMCEALRTSGRRCFVRVANLYSPRHIVSVISGFECINSHTCHKVENKCWIVPDRIVFLNVIKDPWLKCTSRSTNCRYYYNRVSKQSVYKFSELLCTDYWDWNGARVHYMLDCPSDVTIGDIGKYICK